MTIESENNFDVQAEKMIKFEVADKDAFMFNHLQMDLARICNNGELNDEQFKAWTDKYSYDFRLAFKEVFFQEDDFITKLANERQIILQELLSKTYELYDKHEHKAA